MEREMRNNSYNRNIAREARLDKAKRENNKPKTQKQKAKERKQRRRRILLKVALHEAIVFLIGAGTMELKNNLLNPPVDGVEYDKDEQETEVNLDEINGTLSIEGSTAEQFRRDIASKTVSDDAQRKATYEVDNAKTPEEVEKIIKEIFIEELNSYGDVKVTDVSFYKTSADHVLYTEQVNGEKVIKIGYDTKENAETEGKKVIQNNAITKITLTTEDGNEIRNIVTLQEDEYHSVYGENEEKKDDFSKYICRKYANVADAGLKWMTSMENDQTDFEVKEKYKGKLKETLGKYYEEQINEAIEKYTSIPENENQIESEKE